jgi:hypothetical protein
VATAAIPIIRQKPPESTMPVTASPVMPFSPYRFLINNAVMLKQSPKIGNPKKLANRKILAMLGKPPSTFDTAGKKFGRIIII